MTQDPTLALTKTATAVNDTDVSLEDGTYPVAGLAERATFVLDAQGVVVDAFRSERGTPRELEAYRTALTRLHG